MDCSPPGSSVHGDSPCKHSGVSWHSFLQGIFQTQGSNPQHPHFSSIQLLSRVWLSAASWTAGRQASLSITNSRSLLKPMSTESVMPSNHLIFCRPLLLPPSICPSRNCSSEHRTQPGRMPPAHRWGQGECCSVGSRGQGGRPEKSGDSASHLWMICPFNTCTDLTVSALVLDPWVYSRQELPSKRLE